MARIKYTALVESIRGSIQGTTFQRNAYGYTVKGKPNMVNPNTFNQVARKKTFSDQARKWRDLTEIDRAAWETYAAAFPIPSRLNPDSNLNGFNYFVKWHSFFNQGGNSGTLANPGTTQGTISWASGDLIRSGGSLFYEGFITLTGSGWRMIVYGTRPIPMGQEYIRNTPKFLASANLTTDYSFDLTDEYNTLYGLVPNVGDWLGIKVVFIRDANGQMVEFPWFQQEVVS